jgi:Arc/MetJ-type ribon-helix-helix transcriptional regulator
MPKTETLTLEIPEDLVAAMRDAIHDGEYRSDDAVVTDALKVWTVDRGLRGEQNATQIRDAVQQSIDQGVYKPVDEVFDRLEAKYQAMVDAETNAKQ